MDASSIVRKQISFGILRLENAFRQGFWQGNTDQLNAIMKFDRANIRNIFVSPYPTLLVRYGSVGRKIIIFFNFSDFIQIELS